MITRIKRYYENNGPLQSTILLAILVFLFYNQLRYGSQLAKAVMTTLLIAGFLAPIPFIGWCVRHPYATLKAARYFQYSVMGFFAVDYLGLIQMPGYVYFILILMIFVYVGWGFWFFSSPAIATRRGMDYDHNRALDSEESNLKEEIEHNTNLLNSDPRPRP